VFSLLKECKSAGEFKSLYKATIEATDNLIKTDIRERWR